MFARSPAGSVSLLQTEPRYQPLPLDFTRLDPEEARRRSREFLELMRERRSVRNFSTEPVDRELIENAIRTAASAPSGANQQPWTFVVVSDPELKQKLREAAEHEEKLLYEERASDEYLSALEPIGTDSVKPHITDAPYVIVVFEQAWGLEPGRDEAQALLRARVGRDRRGLLLASLHEAGLGDAHALALADGLPEGDPRPARQRAAVRAHPGRLPRSGRGNPEFALWEKEYSEVSAWI